MSLELTDLIGPGVAVVAVAVGVWQYRLTSLREFIKPVRARHSSSSIRKRHRPRLRSPRFNRDRLIGSKPDRNSCGCIMGHWRSSKASIMRPRAVKDSRSNTP